jgi:hypothetical protein
MTHLATSRVLEKIIIEFRKKGLSVPPKVLTDLKSARVLMRVEAADRKSFGETTPKIEEYLSSVEAYLITEAQKTLPQEQIDKWLRNLEAASYETCSVCEEETRFVAGLPRGQKWIRVEPLADIPLEKIKQFADETNLSFREEKDGHLTVFGSNQDIKDFVKKIAKQTSKE